MHFQMPQIILIKYNANCSSRLVKHLLENKQLDASEEIGQMCDIIIMTDIVFNDERGIAFRAKTIFYEHEKSGLH